MRSVILSTILLTLGSAVLSAQNTSDSASINLRKTVTTEVVRKTKDAVVNISTTKMISQRISPFGFDPFWQQFDFGDIVKVPANSLGSGFIIHGDGYVVTNHHVIDRARQINVELADGRKLPAELISSDAEADLAILRIHSDKPLPMLELGDSSDLMIGEPVIAVGNPLGFSHSVSTGIVSALHRDLKDQQDRVMLGDLIQTDAAINPGNSGGPLLNAYGQVIGINTAIRGDAQNIGFAIPVNKLRDLIPELMNPAQVTKVDIAVKLVEKRHIVPPANVSVVVGIAEKEGWRAVSEIGGIKPRNIVDAYAVLLKAKVGQEISILSSTGKPLLVKATAVPLPDAIVQAKSRLGMTVEGLTPMLAQKYGLSAEQGLFVTQVARDSIAARAGVQAGDVVVQLGRYRVRNLDDFATILQHLPEKGRVRIGVVRGDLVGFKILDL